MRASKRVAFVYTVAGTFTVFEDPERSEPPPGESITDWVWNQLWARTPLIARSSGAGYPGLIRFNPALVVAVEASQG